jgi:hypothetical protein
LHRHRYPPDITHSRGGTRRLFPVVADEDLSLYRARRVEVVAFGMPIGGWEQIAGLDHVRNRTPPKVKIGM